MTSSIEISALSKRLQCAICLHTVCKPKNLNCNHSYCKCCLDKLLKFNPNGSASIQCPHGCDIVTEISCRQTTNDLPANNDERVSKMTCRSCRRDVKLFCIHCERFKCEQCPDEHDDDDSFVPVEFLVGQNEIVILCKEHSTEASRICCETIFICVYCVHRDHKGHRMETFADVELSLKAFVTEELDKRGLDKHQKGLQKDIADVTHNLEEALKMKKLKCISEYIAYLDREEESMKYELDVLGAKHTSAFHSVSYLQNCLTKEGSQLLLQRNGILNKLKDIDSDEKIPSVTVSLTDGKFNDEHPLGSVNVVHETLNSNNKNRSFKSEIKTEDIGPYISSLKSIRGTIARAVSGGKRKLSDGASSSDEITIESDYPVPGFVNLEVNSVSDLEKTVQSDIVVIRNVKWRMMFQRKKVHWQTGEAINSSGIYVLCALGTNTSCKAEIKFRLLSHKGSHFMKRLVHNFTKRANFMGVSSFIPWNDLTDPEKGYIKNNSITLQAVIKAEAPILNAANGE